MNIQLYQIHAVKLIFYITQTWAQYPYICNNNGVKQLTRKNHACFFLLVILKHTSCHAWMHAYSPRPIPFSSIIDHLRLESKQTLHGSVSVQALHVCPVWLCMCSKHVRYKRILGWVVSHVSENGTPESIKCCRSCVNINPFATTSRNGWLLLYVCVRRMKSRCLH